MNKYEQLKLINGTVYDIVPGGIFEEKDALTITIIMGENTLAMIDNETDDPENTKRMEIIDRSGEVMDLKKGFVYQTECIKKKDYVIERRSCESVQTDTNETNKVDYEDITGSVAIIRFEKSDIRKEIEELKKTVSELVSNGK